MSTEENKAFVRELFKAIGSNDGKFLKNTFADDLKFWVAGSLPVLSGTHSKQFLARLGKARPKNFLKGDLTLTPLAMTAESDRVAVVAKSKGDHFSGKTYNNLYHILLVIRDGQVHEWKKYMDTHHAYDVLISDGEVENYG